MEYRLLSEGGAYFWNKAPPLKHGLKNEMEVNEMKFIYENCTYGSM